MYAYIIYELRVIFHSFTFPFPQFPQGRHTMPRLGFGLGSKARRLGGAHHASLFVWLRADLKAQGAKHRFFWGKTTYSLWESNMAGWKMDHI